MDIDELAAFLNKDVRKVFKMAGKGLIPGRKVAGEWRFHSSEINYWIENQLLDQEEETLAHLETHAPSLCDRGLLVAKLLPENCIANPLKASTRASVLRELVNLADLSLNVYDHTAIHQALVSRELLASTALPGGVAFPHPHRPIPNSLGESVLALGIVPGGIPFGSPDGRLTDVFFLVCCTDELTHLQALARITRLIRREGFLDSLRLLSHGMDIWHLIRAEELALVAS